jgi:iron complex outermembrane receptor protein
MSYRKTLLVASIIAGLCLTGAIHAQDGTLITASPKKSNAKELGMVIVTAIRDSEADSCVACSGRCDGDRR